MLPLQSDTPIFTVLSEPSVGQPVRCLYNRLRLSFANDCSRFHQVRDKEVEEDWACQNNAKQKLK